MNWYMFLNSILSAGVRMGIPIAFAGIGVVISEKSGVLNIGCEAEMLLGAFIAFAVEYATGSITLGILCGGLAGALTALVIAFLAVSRKQDQSVVGIILNVFMVGFTSFLFRAMFGTAGSAESLDTLPTIKIPGLSKIPLLGTVFFSQNILFFILIAVAIVSWYIMNRLKVGLQLRAVGENPKAAQSAGINVIKVRYAALSIGGFLAGIGGSYLVVAILGKFTENVSAGRGFIGMAVDALCHWNPIAALGASFAFGIADGLQLRLQAYGIEIPYQILLMLPYVVTLVSLVAFGRGGRAPKDLGHVFDEESRA